MPLQFGHAVRRAIAHERDTLHIHVKLLVAMNLQISMDTWQPCTFACFVNSDEGFELCVLQTDFAFTPRGATHVAVRIAAVVWWCNSYGRFGAFGGFELSVAVCLK